MMNFFKPGKLDQVKHHINSLVWEQEKNEEEVYGGNSEFIVLQPGKIIMFIKTERCWWNDGTDAQLVLYGNKIVRISHFVSSHGFYQDFLREIKTGKEEEK